MSWRNLHPCLSVTAGLIFASLQIDKKGPKIYFFPALRAGYAWIQDLGLIVTPRTKFLDPPLLNHW
jgi:hypothetical protein